MKWILNSSDPIQKFTDTGGGKAANLARLCQKGFPVPEWFCLNAEALQDFIDYNRLATHLNPTSDLASFSLKIQELFLQGVMPPAVERTIEEALVKMNLSDRFVAVRSSGLDEDSAENSFAGQFSSYLFQKGLPEIIRSVKLCWASGFSERALSYRIERGLPLTQIRIGVVIQLMVNADAAGVAFSRNPIRPLDRDHLLVSSVWGLGEGLVSGELDADHFEVNRKSFQIKPSIVEKAHAFRQGSQGGLVKESVVQHQVQASSLSDEQIRQVAQLTLALEEQLNLPQDCEWAFEKGRLYFVQTRPITTLPRDPFFSKETHGDFSILWDNSNIIESYSGVTSPLTFSFASAAYRQVYIQFCEVVGVPKKMIEENETLFRNMLGLLRGRIYYNLLHWYQLVLMLPGASKNKGFMDTMMGVKQKLKPELAKIFESINHPPKYSLGRRALVLGMTLYRFIRINTIIETFQTHFNTVYERSRKLPFAKMSLPELARSYQELEDQVLKRWHAPIINDYLCMIFFGILKKLTEKWIAQGDSGASLQNDLLCGQGDLESTEPTKMLMRIAERVDLGDPIFRDWLVRSTPQQVWDAFRNHQAPGLEAAEIQSLVFEFLDRYGFRCINELKLEESDLHDDPTFIINAIASYVRMKSYSILAMEEREKEIRQKAEALVRERISGPRAWIYFWMVKQARKAVKNRENLRFARTKIFGVARHLFRGIGSSFVKLEVIAEPRDIFYLTVDEIFSYIEGRSTLLNFKELVALRKKEFDQFRKTPAPPDRLTTTGAVGVNCLYPQVLFDSDLLKDELPASTDPSVLLGTPCCPGIIEGPVRVVESVSDAQGLNGEILVTARTDPGWVPLFPSCSGLLVERGSLLSHSAVVARELGLPTIVGISGGLMKKLKTGQIVRIDAGKGEVRILA